MRNIAKCKLCHSVIESFHSQDYVSCKCDEISVSGGQSMYCHAKNWNNFLRIDDMGNEVSIKKINEDELDKELALTKKDYINMLENYVKTIDELPHHFKYAQSTQQDLCIALSLILSVFKASSQ